MQCQLLSKLKDFFNCFCCTTVTVNVNTATSSTQDLYLQWSTLFLRTVCIRCGIDRASFLQNSGVISLTQTAFIQLINCASEVLMTGNLLLQYCPHIFYGI